MNVAIRFVLLTSFGLLTIIVNYKFGKKN